VGLQNKDGIDGVEAIVEDNGPGISPEIVEQVFDPFFTTRQGTGTGLGLSISQTLIQRAGGVITVESSNNRGSRFFIWLPIMDTLSKAKS
ncbi:MAG: HAMP domain-containing sensor histidine kinase, partial [Sneathiella sp.]